MSDSLFIELILLKSCQIDCFTFHVLLTSIFYCFITYYNSKWSLRFKIKSKHKEAVVSSQSASRAKKLDTTLHASFFPI